MTPDTDEFIYLLPALKEIEAAIQKNNQARLDLIIGLFRRIGLPELAEKIKDYGLPNKIYVPYERKNALSYLHLICPVHINPKMDREDRVIFSWAPMHRVILNQKMPLLKRVHPIEGTYFPDAYTPSNQ